jgi:hypothetical protein
VKHGISPALVLTFLGFLLAATPTRWQLAVPHSPGPNAANLPDAPSSATTCTENNGKPCPERVHKLIGQYPPSPESRTQQPARDPDSVHFWTYRGWQEPPLRTNKQVFHSKVFVATHIGGAIAMIVACRPKNPGYDWKSQAPAVGAIFGMDYLQFRFIGGPNAVGAPIYEMVQYSRASTR